MNLIADKTASERVFRIPLTLHPKQKYIDDHFKRFTIVRAGRKFGKTTYARKKALEWLAPPNSSVWFLAPTYKQGKLIVWADFKRMIPQEALKRKPNDTDLTIQLKNGSTLYVMGSDEPDSLRGPKPSAVIFEEAAQHKPETWYEVMRPNLIPTKAPALFIGTPKGYNWMKTLEDDARASIARGEDDWAVFHFSIYDNPTLDVSEIEKARRDSDNPVVWSQEYMAEYESSVGRVFNSFSAQRHVAAVAVPHGIPCYRAMDWGQRDPTACLWGYINGQTLLVYREHLENDMPPRQQADLILNKTEPRETIEGNIIGHDAVKNDLQMQGLSVLWHFNNAGIRPIRPSSKDKKSSRSMLNQLIQENRLVIDPRCPKLIKQLLAYEWNNTVMEKTADGNDDAVDALHYLVELLQFKLFLTPHLDPVTDMAKIHADIQAEKDERINHPKLPMHSEELGAFDFSGNPAGYL